MYIVETGSSPSMAEGVAIANTENIALEQSLCLSDELKEKLSDLCAPTDLPDFFQRVLVASISLIHVSMVVEVFRRMAKEHTFRFDHLKTVIVSRKELSNIEKRRYVILIPLSATYKKCIQPALASLSKIVKDQSLFGFRVCVVPAVRPRTYAEWMAFNEMWPLSTPRIADPRVRLARILSKDCNSFELYLKHYTRYLYRDFTNLSESSVSCIVVDSGYQKEVREQCLQASQIVASSREANFPNDHAHSILYGCQPEQRSLDFPQNSSIFHHPVYFALSEANEINDYLCTGYDVFITHEPCLFCAMALVHSRVRRVFFGSRGIDMSLSILNDLSSLNHHFELILGGIHELL